MTKEHFIANDKYCQLREVDIACAGGNKTLAIQSLLDDRMETVFSAVLDLDDETVWTAEIGRDGNQIRDEDGIAEIAWQVLEEFEG